MRDCVVMSDLRCTEKACYEPYTTLFRSKQNANALTIVVAKKLRRQRDYGSGLLGCVGSDEKMHVVQLILFSHLSVRPWLGNRFRFAEDFFPGAHPGFVDVTRLDRKSTRL